MMTDMELRNCVDIEDFGDDPEELQWREEQIDYLMKPAQRSGVIW